MTEDTPSYGNDDFEVNSTGTHRVLDESHMILQSIGEKVEACLARFQLHHEFMIGSEVLDER